MNRVKTLDSEQTATANQLFLTLFKQTTASPTIW